MLSIIASVVGPISTDRRVRKERPVSEKLQSSYYHCNRHVCRTFVCVVYGTSPTSLARLWSKADEMGRNGDGTFLFDETRGGDQTDNFQAKKNADYVIGFINALAESHALPDPGRLIYVGWLRLIIAAAC